MKPFIKCVPNFSEGRRPEVIRELVETLSRAGGVYILDVSSDHDHNRTVVTMAGLPEEVEKAVFAGVRFAGQHINLDEHSGVHPRFGAADVIPFVPLRDTTLAQCVESAHRVGRRIAEELNLPVYFYEAAAMRPDYSDLARIRRPSFQYEHLKASIGSDPNWMPDAGPAELTTAGACLIGARQELIAFNVNLNTDNLEIARQIARAIRFSDGGLRYVKSSAFLVDGRAQVSMNLTDYRQTPVHRVVEMIRREAARYGVGIAQSELIGLIPEAAVVESAAWYLQLDHFTPDQIFERRLAQVIEDTTPFSGEEPPIPEDATTHITLTFDDGKGSAAEFVASVAQPTITPAGGAVSALTGALGAALSEMVAGLTVGKRGYESVESAMQAIRPTAQALRERLLTAIDHDVEAFNTLMNALRLPKSAPERDTAIERASIGAAEVPLEVARLSFEVLQLLRQVVELGNHNAAIDAAVGAHTALAAIEGAALNVRVNLLGVSEGDITRYLDEIEHITEAARGLTPQIVALASERVGLN